MKYAKALFLALVLLFMVLPLLGIAMVAGGAATLIAALAQWLTTWD